MKPTDDKKLELLYGHYTDTYAGIQTVIKSRDRFFISILVLLAFMSFQIALPTESGSVIADFVRTKLGVHGTLSVSFLGTAVWAGLLFAAVRYFQVVVYLERQYKYIHALEAELSPFYSGIPFTREGAFYEAEYPWFSAVVHRLYSWVFPVGLVLAVTLKIVSEIRLPHLSAYALAADTVIYALLLTAAARYMVNVLLKK